MHDTFGAPGSSAVALVAYPRSEGRRAVVSALAGTGWRVAEAADSESALRLAAIEPPRLAVVDAHLPSLDDGRHPAVALRQLPTPHGPPQIVLIAARRDARIEALAAAAGGARIIVGARPMPPDTSSASGPPVGLAPRHLWVVDDTPAIRALARGAFERAGWRVADFADLRAAYDGLSALPPPDAVLLDIHLPDGNGLGHIGVFASAGAAVLMVSNLAGPDQVELAFAAGASDVIAKPFDLRALVARVERALRPRAAAVGSLSVARTPPP